MIIPQMYKKTEFGFRNVTLLMVLCILFWIIYAFTKEDSMFTRLRFNVFNGPNGTNCKNQSARPVVYLCDKETTPDWSPCLCYIDFDPTGDIIMSQRDTMRFSNVSAMRCAITFFDSGRIGNVIGQYAALYTLSRLNRRPGFMTPEMAAMLQKYFKISIPVLSEKLYSSIQWTNVGINDWMEDNYAHVRGTFIKFSGYPSSYTFHQTYREEIKREFMLKDEIRDRAQVYLRNLTFDRKSVTFVGVHVRRGDYINLMNEYYHGVLADRQFFAEATNYFRSRYSDAVFMVVSDGMDWCRENIPNDYGDVYYVGDHNETDPIGDFALLMNCNHSIITIGTFSYFSALFAGGEVVYLTNFTVPNSVWNKIFHYDSAFAPEWHPIAANLSAWYAANNFSHNSTAVNNNSIQVL